MKGVGRPSQRRHAGNEGRRRHASSVFRRPSSYAGPSWQPAAPLPPHAYEPTTRNQLEADLTPFCACGRRRDDPIHASEPR